MTCMCFRQVNGVFEQMIFPIHLPDGQEDSIWKAYLNLLSHPSILGVTLCFCTGSYAAAAAAAAAAAGRRFLSTR